MPLLLMESDGVTNCSQKLLHVARTVGILGKAVAVAVVDEIARDAHAFTLWLTTALHCSYIVHDATQSRRPSALS